MSLQINWSGPIIKLGETTTFLDKKKEIVFLETKTKSIEELNDNAVVCYYFDIEKTGFNYIKSDLFRKNNVFKKNSDGKTKELNWKGVYIYILKNGKKYIGQGDYIDRFNNHTKTKPWSDEIKKKYLFLLSIKKNAYLMILDLNLLNVN